MQHRLARTVFLALLAISAVEPVSASDFRNHSRARPEVRRAPRKYKSNKHLDRQHDRLRRARLERIRRANRAEYDWPRSIRRDDRIHHAIVRARYERIRRERIEAREHARIERIRRERVADIVHARNERIRRERLEDILRRDRRERREDILRRERCEHRTFDRDRARDRDRSVWGWLLQTNHSRRDDRIDDILRDRRNRVCEGRRTRGVWVRNDRRDDPDRYPGRWPDRNGPVWPDGGWYNGAAQASAQRALEILSSP